MPRHQRTKSTSGYYHIMLRGNEKKDIFNSNADKLRFLETVFEKKQGNRFYLHAFCLMNNHVHLMISEGIEGVATVMKRINVSYVYYFNNKYKRVGHLFQDRFKSEVVEQDRYLLALVRYIHQNPVKAGIVEKADDYRWSSHNCYLYEDNFYSKILDIDPILRLFSEDRQVAVKKYIEYMNQECSDTFIDLEDDVELIDEKQARELFKRMLISRRVENRNKGKIQIPDSLIKEFREKTNLSLRKIAAITGLNKDKVNKILKT